MSFYFFIGKWVGRMDLKFRINCDHPGCTEKRFIPLPSSQKGLKASIGEAGWTFEGTGWRQAHYCPKHCGSVEGTVNPKVSLSVEVLK